jgi:hypothetical protein
LEVSTRAFGMCLADQVPYVCIVEPARGRRRLCASASRRRPVER